MKTGDLLASWFYATLHTVTVGIKIVNERVPFAIKANIAAQGYSDLFRLKDKGISKLLAMRLPS